MMIIFFARPARGFPRRGHFYFVFVFVFVFALHFYFILFFLGGGGKGGTPQLGDCADAQQGRRVKEGKMIGGK